jgi:ribosomal protein L24
MVAARTARAWTAKGQTVRVPPERDRDEVRAPMGTRQVRTEGVPLETVPVAVRTVKDPNMMAQGQIQEDQAPVETVEVQTARVQRETVQTMARTKTKTKTRIVRDCLASGAISSALDATF